MAYGQVLEGFVENTFLIAVRQPFSAGTVLYIASCDI